MPGATLDPRTELQREIAAHAAQWDLAGIDSYTFTINRLCFCPPEYSGPFHVTVEEGVATAVTFGGKPADPQVVAGFPLTIDAVFVSLLDLAPEATLTGTWHAELGYPTEIAVDPIPNVADDEYTITIEDVVPAG